MTWTQEQHEDTGRERRKEYTEDQGTGGATVQRHSGEVQRKESGGSVQRTSAGEREEQERQTVQRRTAL